MRNIKRIDNFLELVDIKNLLTNIWKVMNEDTPEEAGKLRTMISLIHIKKDEIAKYWYESPDERFSQVLVNMGITPNYPGFWYYLEEPEILEAQGLPLEDFLLWGVNFDKDMNQLPQTDYRLIKDLNTDHIEAILDGKYTKRPMYLKAFNSVLNQRKEGLNGE